MTGRPFPLLAGLVAAGAAAIANARLSPKLHVDAVLLVGGDARQPEQVDPHHAAGSRIFRIDLVAEQADVVSEALREPCRLPRHDAARPWPGIERRDADPLLELPGQALGGPGGLARP